MIPPRHPAIPGPPPVPTVQRLAHDVLLLTGDAVDAVEWLLHVTISARYRDGRDVPPSIRELARKMAERGQTNTVATQSVHHQERTIGVDELADLLGLSRRQARRLAPELGGRLEAGRWVVDTDTAHTYARSRTA